MNIWSYIKEKLADGKKIILLCVVQSEGSSPGRQGFKMAVAGDGDFCGTIGGGIMEFKMVEKARDLLKKHSSDAFLQIQYHDKEHAKDQSGMICSGKQTIAFIPLSAKDLDVVQEITVRGNDYIVIGKNGLQLFATGIPGFRSNDSDWQYIEKVENRNVIHIIGGGHVSLALSELMKYLDFHVNVYDDRPGLDTLETNSFADRKFLVDYDKIIESMDLSENDFVVIMTMGYRDGLRVFRQLLGKPVQYLGMLGSESKIETLFDQLRSEGLQMEMPDHFFIPIGLNIYSKTPKEIAVSIAARIILEKNKHQPTGRKMKAAFL